MKMTHIPSITIEAIPHMSQTYNTAGNYGEDTMGVWVTVSEMEDWKHEACVALHEFVEIFLTKASGIPWDAIDHFDMEGEGKFSDDPGMLPNAPYHKEHLQALELEKRFAEMLGVDWIKYNNALDALEYGE